MLTCNCLFVLLADTFKKDFNFLICLIHVYITTFRFKSNISKIQHKTVMLQIV